SRSATASGRRSPHTLTTRSRSGPRGEGGPRPDPSRARRWPGTSVHPSPSLLLRLPVGCKVGSLERPAVFLLMGGRARSRRRLDWPVPVEQDPTAGLALDGDVHILALAITPVSDDYDVVPDVAGALLPGGAVDLLH